jgi:hypothetical protein
MPSFHPKRRAYSMSTVILTDKSQTPDDSSLQATLESVFPFFKKLQDLTKSYTQEWKFYNTKSGWTYKIAGKKKALCWVTPYQGNLSIGFALRESEKETLLNSAISSHIREILSNAEKFPEGFALRLNIKNEAEFKDLEVVLGVVMGLRK